MEHFKKEFKGKSVLVTGSTNGVGADIALRFSKLGANVGIVGRKIKRIRYIASKFPVKPLCMLADLSNDQQCECVAKTFIDKFGCIDILINATNKISSDTIETARIDEFDKIMNTNVRGMFHITMLLAPELIKTKGCIVNVTCICGPRAMPNLVSYSVSNAAVEQFTQCVATELGVKGVRCNAINPNNMEKLLYSKKLIDDAQYREYWSNYKRTRALPREAEDDEIIIGILFLSSKMSSYITGTTLHVDGGRHVMNA